MTENLPPGFEGYETTEDTAKRLGVTVSRVHQLLRKGHFPGRIKVGNNPMYLIPKDSWPSGSAKGPSPVWEERQASDINHHDQDLIEETRED